MYQGIEKGRTHWVRPFSFLHTVVVHFSRTIVLSNLHGEMAVVALFGKIFTESTKRMCQAS